MPPTGHSKGAAVVHHRLGPVFGRRQIGETGHQVHFGQPARRGANRPGPIQNRLPQAIIVTLFNL